MLLTVPPAACTMLIIIQPGHLDPTQNSTQHGLNLCAAHGAACCLHYAQAPYNTRSPQSLNLTSRSKSVFMRVSLTSLMPSYIIVDATPSPPGEPVRAPKPEGTLAPGMPATRDALLAAIAPNLDPAQHTVLAMVQVRECMLPLPGGQVVPDRLYMQG